MFRGTFATEEVKDPDRLYYLDSEAALFADLAAEGVFRFLELVYPATDVVPHTAREVYIIGAFEQEHSPCRHVLDYRAHGNHEPAYQGSRGLRHL